MRIVIDLYQLMRNDGLAHSHEGRYKQALDSYSQVIDPESLSPKVIMPVRTHAELLHYQTLATLKSPARDIERVIALWKADITSAITLRSQQRFEEACMVYEVMKGDHISSGRLQNNKNRSAARYANSRSRCDWMGWRRVRRALTSIWRMRSRVSLKHALNSSSVWQWPSCRP